MKHNSTYSGEGETDTRYNRYNSSCITTAFFTIREVESISCTLIALPSSNVLQTKTLASHCITSLSLGSVHVAGALLAVGVPVEADGALVAVVTKIVVLALALSGACVAFIAGASRLGALALLADGEAKVTGFAVVTALSSVLFSAEAFSGVDVTYLMIIEQVQFKISVNEMTPIFLKCESPFLL